MSILIPIYDYRLDKTSWLELPDDELWVCGADFCDRCGDCLACYGSDSCYGTDGYDEHTFVVYRDQLDGFMKRHSGAKLTEK